MKLETVKSFILVVLIGISIILSYTLWSYQPNSSQMIGGDIAGNEMDAGGSGEETKRSLIKPSDIIFHTNERYYGFHDAAERDRLFQQMQEWTITNFEVYNSGAQQEDIPAEGIEIIFPEEIPMEALASMLTISTSEEDPFPDWPMKRLFISFIHDSKSLQVDFRSDESDQRATALITDADIFDQLLELILELDENTLREYLAINEEENAVYFPSGEVELPTYSITPAEIRPALFVQILFPNPAVVRETSSQTIGEAYFTDNRQMNVYQNGMRMEYVSHVTPTPEEMESDISAIDLIDRSILNINSHNGWTQDTRLVQDYRLEDLHLDRHEVTFQMYYKGYPVFNPYQLAVIQQQWGVYQNSIQLIEYERPLYQFDEEFVLREVSDFASGESILSFLETDPSVSMENIEDITIGYEMNYQREDQESEYLEMVPAWYKKENNSWQKIVFNEDRAPRGGN